MKCSVANILRIFMLAALIVTNALLLVEFIPHADAQSSRASNISNMTDYAAPGGDPWGTAFDGSGRLWVALPGCDLHPACPGSTPPGKIALFDPSQQSWTTIVRLPSGYGQPTFVAVDQNGKVWFTMPVTDNIGMFDPTTGNVSQWTVPTASAGPWGIAIDSKGTIWFTEHYVNQIASFDPVSQTFHEFATPNSNSNPYGIVVDASDNIWFTENSVAVIGEYTNQGVLQEYKIHKSSGSSGLTPHMITIDPAGNIWWSEGWAGAIGTLDLAAAQPGTNNGITEYTYSPACHTSGIKADKQGMIWLDDSCQNTLGSFSVGGSFSFYPTSGHPYDGLNVDTQNRIWYDKEFANHITVAIPSGATPLTVSKQMATTTSKPAPTSTHMPIATMAPTSSKTQSGRKS
ncbi:MAG TPA: hypothetical protein VFB12_09295 [Ktedonobacteraceae bacterium]|nr:hypothetical protein [Ktedonobacteraceae bacterium]